MIGARPEMLARDSVRAASNSCHDSQSVSRLVNGLFSTSWKVNPSGRAF